MQEIINTITEWPVIIQGALGSALFWIILLIGEKSFNFISKLYSTHSSNSRKTWIINRAATIGLVLAENNETKTLYLTALTYRASRFLFKALMWLSLGLISKALFQPLSVIGFIGCLYYLIKGHNVVKGTGESVEDLTQEKELLKEELMNINS